MLINNNPSLLLNLRDLLDLGVELFDLSHQQLKDVGKWGLSL